MNGRQVRASQTTDRFIAERRHTVTGAGNAIVDIAVAFADQVRPWRRGGPNTRAHTPDAARIDVGRAVPKTTTLDQALSARIGQRRSDGSASVDRLDGDRRVDGAVGDGRHTHRGQAAGGIQVDATAEVFDPVGRHRLDQGAVGHCDQRHADIDKHTVVNAVAIVVDIPRPECQRDRQLMDRIGIGIGIIDRRGKRHVAFAAAVECRIARTAAVFRGIQNRQWSHRRSDQHAEHGLQLRGAQRVKRTGVIRHDVIHQRGAQERGRIHSQ